MTLSFALIDIQFNRIEVPTSTFSEHFREAQKIDGTTQDKVAVRLLTSDQLYSDTRYLHMITVGRVLQEGARAQKQLRKDFDDKFSVYPIKMRKHKPYLHILN